MSFRTFFVLVLEKLPGDHKETSFHPTTSTSLPVDSITPMTYIKVCCNKFAYWRVVAYSLFLQLIMDFNQDVVKNVLTIKICLNIQ